MSDKLDAMIEALEEACCASQWCAGTHGHDPDIDKGVAAGLKRYDEALTALAAPPAGDGQGGPEEGDQAPEKYPLEKLTGEAMENFGVMNDSIQDLAQKCREFRADIAVIAIRTQDSGVRVGPDEGPKVVCLCGSTRFLEAEREAYWAETLHGNIVLSHSGKRTADKPTGGFLDRLHLRKIDLANEVLVLNIDGYIGESTAREITYAEEHGKPIRYLEDRAALRESHEKA